MHIYISHASHKPYCKISNSILLISFCYIREAIDSNFGLLSDRIILRIVFKFESLIHQFLAHKM